MMNRIAVTRDYAGLWQQFFTFFADDLAERAVTPEEESEFHNLISLLALNHYKFQELTKGYFNDAPAVVDVLVEVVTLDQMRNMSEASLSKIQVDWHSLFIGMHKALGKMLGELSPKELAMMNQQDQQHA